MSSSILVLPPLTPRSSKPSTPRSTCRAAPSASFRSPAAHKDGECARSTGCARMAFLAVIGGLCVLLAAMAAGVVDPGRARSEAALASDTSSSFAAASGHQGGMNNVPPSGPEAALVVQPAPSPSSQARLPAAAAAAPCDAVAASQSPTCALQAEQAPIPTAAVRSAEQVSASVCTRESGACVCLCDPVLA